MEPPRIPRSVIHRLLPPDQREFVLGDLEEEFHIVAARRGGRAARRWYWYEAVRAAVRRSEATAPLTARPAPWPRHVLTGLRQDLRDACRRLIASPGFMLGALLTLALGIGVNTAIFSVVDGVLLEPLPYPDPDRLVRIFDEHARRPKFPVSPANFLDQRERNEAVVDLAVYMRGDLQLGGERPEQLRGMRVSSGFFRAVGIEPALGRGFDHAEELGGRGRVVVLSHALWRRRFNGDAGLIGDEIVLSGRTFVVVGILPPGFHHVGGDFRTYGYGETVDVWWPLTLEPGDVPRGSHYLNLVGRLADGVTIEQAAERLNATATDLEQEHPLPNNGWRVRVVPLTDEIVGPTRPILLALLAAVTLVLLIACGNVAGLLLARAAGRTRETAVRAALGATRGRIVRLLAVESLVIAVAGGLLGLAVARVAVDAVVALGPELPRLQSTSVDGRVLLYTVAVTLTAALVFGLAPAIQTVRADLNEALKQGGVRTSAPSRRLRRVLVTGQVALAFVLFVSAGLLTRSFVNLISIAPGFDAGAAMTLGVTLPPARYPDAAAVEAFFRRLTADAAALPGVTAAGMGGDLPWSGYDEGTGFEIVGRPTPPEQSPGARYHFVTPGFLEAIGVPLVEGRLLAASDDGTTAPVILVNETAARMYWRDAGAGSPIGARVNIWDAECTVVGIVGDVRDMPWEVDVKPAVYFPFSQQPSRRELFLVARSGPDAAELAAPLGRLVHALDPELPVRSVRPLAEVASLALAGRRFTLTLVGAFAVTALVLAVVGVYGVIVQLATARVREFGVRRALGAPASDIRRMVVGDGLRLALAGLAVGGAAALVATRWFSSLLYDVSPADPWTFLAVGGLMLVVAAASGYAPARRASLTDPVVVLRAE